MPAPVLYRKWRPQTLSQVVGQEHVTRPLLNALSSERVAHAYLFTGPRGTGKTSTARILAKAINCTKNDGHGEPCGSCDICLSIAEDRAMDSVVEIDAASNRSIDDIKELRSKINFHSGEAQHKVYIIDEVHMLTDQAFNALLKTLEEPPPFVIFVLATTEIHKVPVTIVSRCQRFDFRRISTDDLMTYLNRICQGEGIRADEDALALLARVANGGARDAVNLLEQVEVANEHLVTLEAVERVLGLTANPLAVAVVKSIAAQSLADGLTAIQRAREEGSNLAQFGKEVTECLRGLLLIKAGITDTIELPNDILGSLTDIAPTISMELISQAVHAFSKIDFRGAEGSSLPLELALLDALEVETTSAAAPTRVAPAPAAARPQTPVVAPKPMPAQPTPQVASMPAAAASPKETAPPVQSTTPEPAEAPTPKPGQTAPAAAAQPKPEPIDVSEELPAPSEPVAIAVPSEGGDALERVRQALRTINVPQMKILANILQTICSADRIEGETLVLSFQPVMAAHRKRIEDNIRIAEDAIRQATGTNYRIRCILSEATATQDSPQSGHLVEAALKAGARRVTPPS